MEENRYGRREFQMMQSNIRRIAIQPVVRRAAAVVQMDQMEELSELCHVTTLTANPRTLHLLWEEYEHGIAGRKAARLYKRGERRSTSIVEEVGLNCIATLVRAGFHGPGCNRSHLPSYGENATVVTTIINRMKRSSSWYRINLCRFSVL
jgi:hypothetical protein